MSLSVFLVGLVVVGLLIAAGISLSELFNNSKIIDTVSIAVIVVVGIWFICGTFYYESFSHMLYSLKHPFSMVLSVEHLPNKEPYELLWQKQHVSFSCNGEYTEYIIRMVDRQRDDKYVLISDIEKMEAEINRLKKLNK